MPATEQTVRDQKKLHFIFAWSSVILLIVTICMFAVDHARSWKDTQRVAIGIDIQVAEWQSYEYDLDQAMASTEALTAALLEAKSEPVSKTQYEAFKEEFGRDIINRGKASEEYLEKYVTSYFSGLEALVEAHNGKAKFEDQEAIVGKAEDAVAARALAKDTFAKLERTKAELNQAKLDIEARTIKATKAASALKRAEGEVSKAKKAVPAAEDKAAAEAAVATAKENFEEKKVDSEAASADVATTAGNIEKLEGDLEGRPASEPPEPPRPLEPGQRADFNAQNDKATLLEKVASNSRDRIVSWVVGIAKTAKFREDKLLGERKFKSANRDKVVADLGLAVRDGKSIGVQNAIQTAIDKVTGEMDALTVRYEAASTHRKALERVISDMTDSQKAAQKEFDANQALIDAAHATYVAKRSEYFSGWLPGKRLLELPILDAFNSPRKIDNLWSDDLMIDYNFALVRRFDRCTTCHQSIDKSAPSDAALQDYVSRRPVELILFAPTADEMPKQREDKDGNLLPYTVEQVYGIHFVDGGLLESKAVSIGYVTPKSLAAAAQVSAAADDNDLQDGSVLLKKLLQPELVSVETAENGPHWAESRQGVQLGDMLVGVNGDPMKDAKRAAVRLLDLAGTGEPIRIQVERGLPHPFSSHPRLDLFMGSLSPHSKAEFACTVCHEGQGSATDFKWASHSPNDPETRKRWAREYGWFDNHHWIFPQFPKRFTESTCLKCHHDVVELEPSVKYPEPPAPKVVHGYNLIRKNGCYGCHEINGFDSGESVGPDLRAEPNTFAAAQQMLVQPGFEKLSEDAQAWTRELVYHPENNDVRQLLLEQLYLDADSEAPVLSEYVHSKLVPLFKDVDSPGGLPKPGPALRYIGTKADHKFLYDWVKNPRHFRPSSRMPVFFGQFDHLEGEPKQKEKTQRLEVVELQSMVTFLLNQSQDTFKPTPRPDWTVPKSDDDRTVQTKRGKKAFELRGCLACHNHGDFPEATSLHDDKHIQQGPDLSNIGDKFDPARNPNGDWLYSWVREPNKYHVRTVMPNLFLEEDEIEGVKVDTAADIAEYLLSSTSGWKPEEGTPGPGEVDVADLNELLDEHDSLTAMATKSVDEKLLFLGRKTVAKYGCYGCHDVPGFEDAKPIGVGLADWGRKDPSKIAFEHIAEYLHGHGGDQEDGDQEDGDLEDGEHEDGDADEHEDGDGDHEAGHEAGHDDDHAGHGHADGLPPFYEEQLMGGHRSGFIYQKLLEPRSYDYHKTTNKKYNDRLRMPKFNFNESEREAVITFVLGLIADPPKAKYVYQPTERDKVLIDGRKLLDKFNCGGCHVLEAEKWQISSPKGFYGERKPNPTAVPYPFLTTHFNTDQVAASEKTDARNLQRVVLEGFPAADKKTGDIVVYDEAGDPLEEGLDYAPRGLEYPFELWKPALIDGKVFEVGGNAINIPAADIEKRYPSTSGFLARYLMPRVVANGKGPEAWGWVPPPLIGEGDKVQSEWLHDFLLEPYEIRPAVVLRMPKFHMTSDEAAKLANYFAAVDNAEYPYAHDSRRQADYLEEADGKYRAASGDDTSRFDAGMRIMANKCSVCHIMDDFRPKGSGRDIAPDLSVIYQRMRPDYLRRWIAKPNRILPYNAMPVNIPFKPEGETLGGVEQNLFHGTSYEQLDGVVDILMNYDRYAKDQVLIAPLVEKYKPVVPAEGAPGEPAPAPVTPPAPVPPAPVPPVNPKPVNPKPETTTPETTTPETITPETITPEPPAPETETPVPGIPAPVPEPGAVEVPSPAPLNE